MNIRARTIICYPLQPLWEERNTNFRRNQHFTVEVKINLSIFYEVDLKPKGFNFIDNFYQKGFKKIETFQVNFVKIETLNNRKIIKWIY
jgi:hypothetical protein